MNSKPKKSCLLIELRQNKYLNNRIEHRFIKWLVKRDWDSSTLTVQGKIKGYYAHVEKRANWKPRKRSRQGAVEIHWTNLWSNCVVASFPKDFSASTSFCNITSKTLPINRFNSSSSESSPSNLFNLRLDFCQSTSPCYFTRWEINWMETQQA